VRRAWGDIMIDFTQQLANLKGPEMA